VNKQIKEQLASKFRCLSLHDKVYTIGACVFGIYVVVAIIYGLAFGKESITEVASVFIYFIATIFTIAVFIEYWFAIKPLIENAWVKLFGAAVVYLVYRYSEGKAADFINAFTKLDPEKLPDALSLLAALFLPYSWLVLVLVSVILAAYIIVVWIIAPFSLTYDKRELSVWRFIGRVVGLSTIFIIFQQLITSFDKEDSIIAGIAQESILRTEYFPSTVCTNAPSNALVADIGRGYISIFEPSSKSFSVEKCRYINITK